MSVKDNSSSVQQLQKTPADPKCLNKYQAAAEAANQALKYSLSLCTEGASIGSICEQTDAHIEQLLQGIYKNDAKGVAFPTSVSPNGIVCHYSPRRENGEETDEEPRTLKHGDLVKIELGVHVDNYPALVGTTVCIGGKPTEEQARLLAAAYNGAELFLRRLRSGLDNDVLSVPMQQLCEDYGVSFIEGLMSHQVCQSALAAGTIIVPNPSSEQRKLIQKATFGPHQVFVLDVAVSSRSGLVKVSAKHRAAIYRRTTPTAASTVRTKAARSLASQVGDMAFHVARFDKGRSSAIDGVAHKVMEQYDVMVEKEDDAQIARFMFTCILMPSGPLKITECSFPDAQVVASACQKKPRQEVQSILDEPVRPPKKTAA